MISPSWSLPLSQQPLHCTITSLSSPCIIYQGISTSLLCQTQNNSFTLPLRKQILSLSTLPSSQILILTRYQLICFNINNNDQVWTKQFQNAQKLYVTARFVYVVCAGDLFCYDHQGQEQWVNHLTANLIAIETYSTSTNNTNNKQTNKHQPNKFQIHRPIEQLALGLDDMSMLRYKGVNMTYDYGKIVGTPTSICYVENGLMVGTEQGSIAYYQSKKSKWKAKSTHAVLKIINFKQGQSSNVLIIRKNSTIELRDWKKGQTIHKIKVGQPIVSIHLSDFRKEGLFQILCICKSAQVKAFNLEEQIKPQTNNAGPEIQDQLKKMDALLKEKTSLQYQISQLEAELEKKQDQNQDGQQTGLHQKFSITAKLIYKKGLTLSITCCQGYISGLSFEQAIMAIKCQRSQKLDYLFQNSNKIAGQILCQALVHSSLATKSYEIKCFKINLSKFWHWGYTQQVRYSITGFVKFDLVQRNSRYIKWMQECFFFQVPEDVIIKMEAMPILKVRFFNAYDKQEIEMVFKSKQGKVEIWTDSLQVLGELVQDLMQYTGTKQLDSQLSFPKEKQKLKQALNNIQKLSQTKVSINSEMAQAINNIKFLLVKGQSSLAVGNLASLRKSYGQIMNQNKGIILQIQKKNMNTTNLSDSLKTVGKFINQTSNVRFGKVKQSIVQHCRQAIKKKDFNKIISIMEKGASAIGLLS